MRKFVLSLAGVGFIPGAPGTYATIVALAIFLAGVRLGAPLWVWPLAAVLSGTLLLLVGVPPAPAGGRWDPRWCVLDEVSGTFVAVTSWHPAHSSLLTAAAALVFFRLFDVLKPPPINLLERLPGSAGVLADDVGAGVLANVCIVLLGLAVPQL